MWSIYKREIQQFLNSLIAYIVIGVFLTGIGLLMWVFPETSVLNYGFADLETLFSLGPFVFMFLIPAITMRMVAEEKKSGTIELLLTKPITEAQILLGKYFAAVTLVLFAILPTLVYAYSVCQLGNPVGNLDIPGVIGSYIGLLLLGAVFAAIGLAASTLTENQIVAFIFAVFLSFFLYTGLGSISALFSGNAAVYIEDLSLSFHYEALSRGLIDTRDLAYFLSTIIFVLFVSYWKLVSRKLSYKPVRAKLIKHFSIGLFIILLINFVAANFFARFDLTADKRYSLKPATKELLGQIDEPLTVEILISGDLPAGFERLKKAIEQTIEEFDIYTPGDIAYFHTDPSDAETAQERQENITYLMQQGFEPTQVFDTENGRQIQKTVFPYVILRYGQRAAGVLMLKGTTGASSQERLNQSIEGIEFELAVGLQRIAGLNRKSIGLVQGHKELDSLDIAGFLGEMRQYFDLVKTDLTQPQTIASVDALVVAQPKTEYSVEEKYALDQYIMSGGKVLFLIDKLQVNMGLAGGEGTFALPIDHGLDDMLFRYGVRINAEYIQDIQNFGRYPVVLDNAENIINLPWPFYASVNDFTEHPITKNLDAVYARFFSTMDTVKADGVVKTPLMFTSPYTRIVNSPAKVAFEDFANEPDAALFDHGKEPVAYLLEGEFTSLFKNRVLPSNAQTALKEQSEETKIVVVSDGDIIRNEKNLRTGAPFELGYNPFADQGEKLKYANKDFLFNALAYLVDENGVITSRAKEITLRPLNRVKVREERVNWQILNLVGPLVLLSIFGLIRALWRKHKYRA
ncbi:gliding motility-associated ABC transporter substrate-binding protein GldG [Roseivirga pacifica]|uniref:gliding motility-associated ABC transporter substrate-binding protein GldG n=1 Tax=Roseivirga pacifica TaxID=1267423 RepID=UPI00293EEB84|nr:gliding motility-associated ABC transporter substrate-binding protein GldG [Roseivirga pacifica]MCO6358297.1 gliding motility-associated ABC transporter substrate-binding protein GldG [Roseivirga pacifica]MCO6366239.1 gliding motility-associated ABC transporter substrate-binding protein GldG [Roseivirga pacifica]MCO6369210.1 gliding motility-associated ABC transporter substrate-binding protein GldG [Roseivirga pacifica]MCO6374028.1 gliding motility-associated ABC transporter substrate-bindin